MVEFALVLPLLLLVLCGIIDLGLLIKDYLAVNQVASEAARVYAVGYSKADAQSAANTWKTSLKLVDPDGNFSAEFYDVDELGNETESGNQVKATVNYTHKVLAPSIVGLDATIPLQVSSFMRKY